MLQLMSSSLTSPAFVPLDIGEDLLSTLVKVLFPSEHRRVESCPGTINSRDRRSRNSYLSQASHPNLFVSPSVLLPGTLNRCRNAIGKDEFEAILKDTDERVVRVIRDLASTKTRQRPKSASAGVVAGGQLGESAAAAGKAGRGR